MKFYELINVLNRDLQDEITLVFPDNNYVTSVYDKIDDIPITYCLYKVTDVYGYDASGYDGIMITIVEE